MSAAFTLTPQTFVRSCFRLLFHRLLTVCVCRVCLHLHVYQVMQAHRVHNLVFSSSATVYGDPQRLPIDEQHPVGGCTNPYGKTKFFIEEMIKDHCKAEKVLMRRWKCIQRCKETYAVYMWCFIIASVWAGLECSAAALFQPNWSSLLWPDWRGPSGYPQQPSAICRPGTWTVCQKNV